MVCASLWEVCPFLNRDGGGVDKEGVNGREEKDGGEEGEILKEKSH